MADVFIAYTKADAAAVRPLAEAVRRLGYSVRRDEELTAHPADGDFIAGEIEAAGAAILVWSESAAASRRVRSAADLARNRNRLIQVSVDGRLPPMPFNQLQCAAIGDWRGEDDHQGWQKVVASLALLVGPREAAAAAPAATVPPPSRSPPAGRAPLAAVLAGLLIVAILVAGYFAWR
jgi:TIR domain